MRWHPPPALQGARREPSRRRSRRLAVEQLEDRLTPTTLPTGFTETLVNTGGNLNTSVIWRRATGGGTIDISSSVAAGTAETDPLAEHYKQLTNDPDAQALMTREAERLCPAVLEAYKDATQ